MSHGKTDLLTKLNDTVQMFVYFLTVLNNSTDVTQSLIFIRGMNNMCDVITILLSMEALKEQLMRTVNNS
jgi:hypothetical protein